jgi:hypothetical protein
MIANLVANYDCCHLMQAAKQKSHPTELYPTRKSNKYPKRERERASTGGKAKGNVSKTHFRFRKDAACRVSRGEDGASPVSTGKENHGWFAA